MTNGLKTSEFYLACDGGIVGAYMALYGIEAGEIFAALSLPATYIGGRSVVKGMGAK